MIDTAASVQRLVASWPALFPSFQCCTQKRGKVWLIWWCHMHVVCNWAGRSLDFWLHRACCPCSRVAKRALTALPLMAETWGSDFRQKQLTASCCSGKWPESQEAVAKGVKYACDSRPATTDDGARGWPQGKHKPCRKIAVANPCKKSCTPLHQLPKSILWSESGLMIIILLLW